MEQTLEARARILFEKVNNPSAPLQHKYRTIPDIIASQILVENESFRAKLPAKKLKVLYSNALLKSLLQVFAIAAKGLHSLSTPGMPRLLILCLDAQTYELIENNALTNGTYIRHSSLVHVKLPEDFRFDSVMATIIHELTHFAAYEIFKNHSRPYRADDLVTKALCERMVNATRERLQMYPWNLDFETPENSLFFSLLQQVFENYNSENIHSELIVRVPQIAALAGEGQALDWLIQFPELLDFYLNQFIPSINLYIASHKNVLPRQKKGVKKSEKTLRKWIVDLNNYNPLVRTCSKSLSR